MTTSHENRQYKETLVVPMNTCKNFWPLETVELFQTYAKSSFQLSVIKPKQKENSLANHKGHRKHSEPIKARITCS